MECLIHRHGISHIMISDQDTQFTVKKAGKQARTMGSFGCIKAYYSEAAGLIECWYGLQKAKLKCQLRRNTLKGWNAIFQDVYTQNIHIIRPLYGAVHSREDAWVQETRGGSRSEPCTVIPNDNWEIYASYPHKSSLYRIWDSFSSGSMLLPGNTAKALMNIKRWLLT